MGAARQILEILKDGQPVQEVAVDREGMLGRAEECLIKLNDQAISRNHLWLKPVEGGVELEKRSEFAPLKVNGRDLTRTLLKMGDIIELGRYRIQLKEAGSHQATVQLAAPAPEVPDLVAAIESPAELAGASVAGPELFAPPIDQSPSEIAVPPESLAPVTEDSPTQAGDAAGLDVFLEFPAGVANTTKKALDQPEVILGRDPGCDVVLNDKKASRNHALIRKAGFRFTIKDLGSANGVYVNGTKIEGDGVELSGDDQIQIGDSVFKFRAVQKGFDAIASQIDPLPQEESVSGPSIQSGFDSSQLEPMAPAFAPMGGTPLDQQIAGIPVIAGDDPSLNSEIATGVLPTGGKQSLLEKFRALPPKRQVIWAVIVAGLFYFLLFDEEEVAPVRKPVAAQQQDQQKPKASEEAKVGEPGWKQEFLALTPDQQKFVKGQIAKAQEMIRTKNYDLAVEELRQAKIYAPRHEEILTLEKFALGEIDRIKIAQEEERKKAELEAIKQRLADLLDQSGGLMKKKKYAQAEKLFPEIQQMDPENADVAKWIEEIQDHNAKVAETKRVEEVKRIANDDAKKAIAAADQLKVDGQYLKAIAAYQDPRIAAAPNPEWGSLAKAGIQECLSKIDEIRSPLMQEAKQSEELQNYKQAYDQFKQALAVDGKFQPAIDGMDRSRKALQAKAKDAYIEAILAESYSDFDMAIRKFKEVLTIVPEDDLYYERATRKLGRLSFHKPASEGAAVTPSAPAPSEEGNSTPW